MTDDATLTGVGFDVNFDSNVLSLASVTGVAGGAVASGSLNDDGDALVFAWADPFGGSWPGNTEADLATVTFDIIDATTDSTVLDIVKSSAALLVTLLMVNHRVIAVLNETDSRFHRFSRISCL